MRILVISNYYPPFEIGGWEQLLYDEVQLLEARGHEVFVLASNHRAAQVTQTEAGVARVLHLESPDHEHYHLSNTLKCRGWQRENRKTLTRVVDSFDPDIVYINGMWNLPRDVAWHIEQLCRDKVIYYVASTWPVDVDAHHSYWRASTRRRMLRMPKQVVGSAVEKWLLPPGSNQPLQYRNVVCVSEFMRKHITEDGAVPEENTKVIHNGVDLVRFSGPRSKSEDAVRFLYAGALISFKGVHTAVEALGVVHREASDVARHTLTILGSGPSEYVSRLQQLVDVNDLNDKVQFMERVSQAEMPDIFAQHDVLLFLSIGPEALPRVVLEAMAAGLLVIGTSAGGTPEIVKDEVNGLLVPPGDANALATSVTRILQDSALRSSLSKAGRATVRESFTLQRMVDQLEANFESIHKYYEESDTTPEYHSTYD